MNDNSKLPFITEIPKDEEAKFEKLIQTRRKKIIRSSQEIVESVFINSPEFNIEIKNRKISRSICVLREQVWHEYLIDEVKLNIQLMQDLHGILATPKSILNTLVQSRLNSLPTDKLMQEVKKICGEYAGRIFPYIYKISLSNTNSRRSRAGKTFEAIIYKAYEVLNYDYDSQSKVGRKIFSDLGLGKKVDSILPNISCYQKRRNKTIIGTMKTSLRERWQEVAEEIERTKIPEIHLLTVDENISTSKAQEMANHNIIIVTYDWVANHKNLLAMKNIISFEEYLFEEIPSILKFWQT